MRRNTSDTSGFTLIELLVVVAIIALLISILLPSLTAARNSARMVACQAILKQFGIANSMYADASDNVFVPGWTNHSRTNPYRWYQNLHFRTTLSMRDTKDEAHDGLICPDAPEEEFTGLDHQVTRHKKPKHPYSAHWDHVYSNQAVEIRYYDRTVTDERGVFIRRSWVGTPSEKGNFVDGVMYEFGNMSNLDPNGRWAQYGDRSQPRGGSWFAAYRHLQGKGLNALFYDGHANYLSTADAYPAGTTAKRRIWRIYAKR